MTHVVVTGGSGKLGRACVRDLIDHGYEVANADTVMTRGNAELAAEVFPDVPLAADVGPHDTLLSIEKARRILGYEPRHSWRAQR